MNVPSTSGGPVGLIGIVMSEADRSAFMCENDGGTGDTPQSFLI